MFQLNPTNKRYLSQVLSIILLFLISSCNTNNKSNELKYSFKLSKQQNSIEVLMTYRAKKQEDTTTLLIPTNYDRIKIKETALIEDVKLKSKGKLISTGFDTYQYIGKEDLIQISYTIPSFSDNTEQLSCEGDDYFIPAINNKFFHMYGDKSLIFPQYDASENQSFDIEIAWEGFPDEWHIANDFGISQVLEGKRQKQSRYNLSEGDLGSSLFFGGLYRKKIFTEQGINFYTYFYGKFNLDEERFFTQIQKVAKAELKLWKHFHHNKEYVISINRKGNDCGRMGGRNMYDSFTFYMPGDFTDKYFPLIFANAFTHEFTHSWIGVDLVARNPNWEEMRWFTEGFTNYYAQRINYEVGITTERQFLSLLNTYIINYYRSPYKNSTNKEYVDGFKFDNKMENLVYDKGAVFAFALDGYIRNSSNNKYTIDDLMDALLTKASKEEINGNLTIEHMNKIANQSIGIDISNLIKEQIINGKTINISSPLIDSLEIKSLSSFNYGFDYITSMKNEIITGVKEGSNAFKAGLKNGSKLTGIKGITNSPSGRMILEVETDNKKSIIEFNPEGVKIEVPLIRKLKPMNPKENE